MSADYAGKRAAIGFQPFEADGWRGWAADGGGVIRALTRPEEGSPLQAAGRGAVYRHPLGDSGEDEALVRICRRGGLTGKALGQAYLIGNRPMRELRVHTYAYRAGLPSAAPIGIAWRRRGPFLFGRFATKLIAGAVSWRDWLRAGNGARAAEVGEVIRAFHDRGVYHADLNVHNVILDGQRVYLIDFDKARVRLPLSRGRRAANLLRLRRSMEKEGFDPEVFDTLCRGYGPLILPGWTEMVYRFRAGWSRMTAGGRHD